MSNRKATFFYGLLIALASVVAGMVIAARFDFTPASFAGTINVPETNSAPLDGPIDAATFRNIAHDHNPVVVSVRTTTPRRSSNRRLLNCSSNSFMYCASYCAVHVTILCVIQQHDTIHHTVLSSTQYYEF